MDDGVSSTYVSTGHVVFFAASVGRQRREDVINSSMYMQLATSDNYLKYDNCEAWIGQCKKLMTLFGWLSLREDSQHYAYDSQVSVHLDHVLPALLGTTVSAPLLKKFQTFLANLPDPSGSPAGLTTLHQDAMDSRPDRDQTSLSLHISFVDSESMITTVFLSSQMPMPTGLPAMAQHLAAERMHGNLDITVVSMEFIERQYRRVRGRITAEVAAAKKDLVFALDGGQGDE